MAKIQTETVVITFNKLIKDSESEVALLSDEQLAALEQVAQELAGDGIIVEAQVA
jgi:hypothetical protein